MMKVAVMMGLALAAITPGMAQAASEPQDVVVVGVPDSSLAAKALSAGRFEDARRKLAAMPVYGENDPARLINLGNAYAGLGRMGQAREAYRAARFAPEVTLVLANGAEESSRDVALRALDRLNPRYAMR
ncbi:tetratricopeptide repeat protein [Sphingobium sp. HBC34]|uniref:Tetratricopeptide repeat protein n=2 Tax=Sphingobium cyanobacteriorum TaxID=3063954 RepID=A0ABT8ZPX5_9SPHN|nr:tetratricopeptide repeat protein [Sphingobium sp. HBC34]MDO7836123.1 tetratricopeptide repeat protein [Sphingobium sp. HBC34]